MLSENLQTLRRAKGLSQEELAEQLHVVRQTVSKWEKGLSVPDADLLIRLSEVLETPVSALLGETVVPEELSEVHQLSEKLARLNEELARQKKRSRKLWRGASVLAGLWALGTLLCEFFPPLYHPELNGVSVFVSANPLSAGKHVLAIFVLILAVVGICKTTKR